MTHLENPIWGDDWHRIREQFVIEPGSAYLNHGSFGNAPQPVRDVQAEWRHRMDVNATRFFRRELQPALTAARLAVAEFLGASEPEGLALVPNVTSAIAAVLANFPLAAGDEVLVTDHGYGATQWAVERACRDAGATMVTVPLALDADAATIVEAVVAGATGRTRLAVLDHVTSATARRLPVEELVPALQERGVTVFIDAAHVPGMLPVDLTALGADFWTGNMHKWAFAPRGAAALYVGEKWRAGMRAPVVSWYEPEGFPNSFMRFGTADLTAYLSAPAGIAFLDELGIERFREHNEKLADYGQSVLAQALEIDPAGLYADPGVPMRTVPIPVDLSGGYDFQAVVSDELGIEVAVVGWNDRALLRVSANVYNAPAEYERLAAGLPGLF
jgi:isopenicillin-N epimerase